MQIPHFRNGHKVIVKIMLPAYHMEYSLHYTLIKKAISNCRGGKLMEEQNKNMKPCPSCGNMMQRMQKACPTCGAKNKKPIYKQAWFIILIIVFVIFVIAVASSGGGDSTNDTTTQNQGAVIDDSDNSNLGNYKGSYQIRCHSQIRNWAPLCLPNSFRCKNSLPWQAADVLLWTGVKRWRNSASSARLLRSSAICQKQTWQRHSICPWKQAFRYWSKWAFVWIKIKTVWINYRPDKFSGRFLFIVPIALIHLYDINFKR